MIKRKPVNRKETLKKTTDRMNLATGFRYGGMVALGTVGVVSIAEIAKAKTPGQVTGALALMVGGILGGFTIGLTGVKMNRNAMKKLVGKPRVCKKIANDLRDKNQRMFVRTLGHVNWKNQTVRDAFMRSYVKGTPTLTARNIVLREIEKAKKKAEYDETLFSASQSL